MSNETERQPLPAEITPVRQVNSRSKGSETLRMFVVALAIVLFVVTLGVLFVLPKYVGSPSKPELAETPSKAGEETLANDTGRDEPPAVSPTLQPAEPTEEKAKLALREQALSQLAAIDQALAALKAKGAEAWAPEAVNTIQQKIKNGETAYSEQRYLAATSHYQEAATAIAALDQKSTSELSEALAAGELALTESAAQNAKQAFERALTIDPQNTSAEAGLKRAHSLDEVSALINEARGYEELGDIANALARYNQALQLDEKASEAAEAISRINQQKNASAFTAAMSEGFRAMEANKHNDARNQFLRALKLKPNAADAKEALAQTNETIKVMKIDQLLQSAARKTQQEDWAATEQALVAAKKLDNDIAGIDNQISTARSRDALEKRLLKYTAETHRLRSDDVHLEALAVLDSARRVTAGPKLLAQISALESAINTARTKHLVTFTSDTETKVTLYKVGDLGSFQQKTTELLAGKYTIVGKRAGFRDIRIEFSVPAATNVDVRATERLNFGAR